ncbi:MAG: glycosyltransferase family 2 protein [Acidiferrobacterales bacterium]
MQTTRNQIVSGLRTVVVIAYLVYAPYYLYWRLGTFNPNAVFFSWIVWTAELFGVLTAFLHAFMVARLTTPVSPGTPSGCKVDVFVTAFNESVSVLSHTVHAAVRMEYPHQTWLLDDGNNPELAALARRLGCRYVARGDNRDAKAGNLNNALAQSDAEFIAVFDADHVPNRNFLTRTLGFFQDANVAFVQTPQDFYNLDSYQHRRHRRLNYIWTEQSLFFRIIQRGKDHWNAAFFCGSCAVLRVSALRKIGGFATGTITEDLHTSIRLHKQRFRSIYLPESLAYGLAPDSIDGFLSQRLRWGQGGMQVWRSEGILFTRGLTLAQRLNYLASVLTYFDGWAKAIFYLAPVVVLTTGVMPIHVIGWNFLWHFLPFYILCFWSYEEIGRGYGRTFLTEQYNMARFAVFMRATFGGLRKHIQFRVTPKLAAVAGGRRNIVPQMTVMAASAIGIVVGINLWLRYRYLEPAAFAANLVWASINLGLAGTVVRYTAGKKHRRQDYRFPIPLPIEIVGGGTVVFGLAEDISTSGCKVILEQVIPQEPVSGRLFLPAGVLPFRAIVRNHVLASSGSLRRDLYPPDPAQIRESREKHSYGLTFTPESDGDALQLEDFLYGSDLQWRFLDLREEITTPVAWLVNQFSGEGRQRKFSLISPEEWLPVVWRELGSVGAIERLGVLARTNWLRYPARLITFEPVASGGQIELAVFGMKSVSKLTARVGRSDRLEVLPAPLYVSFVSMDSRDSVPEDRQRSRPGMFVEALCLLLAGTMLIAGFLLPGRVFAADWLGLAGAETDENHGAYLYAGAVLPVGKNSVLGNGWVQRYWADWLAYRFQSSGVETLARAPGVSASLGRQGRISGWNWGIYGGLGYRDTRLSPDDPSVKVRGSQTYPLLSLELGRLIGQAWRFDGITSFTIGPSSYWARIRILHRLAGKSVYQGMEWVGQGDRDYHGNKLGYVIDGLPAGNQGSIGFKIGVGKIQGLKAGAYAGIEYARSFGGR